MNTDTDNSLDRANKRLAILLGLLALGIFLAFCWTAMT
jgi:hypothetical protein